MTALLPPLLRYGASAKPAGRCWPGNSIASPRQLRSMKSRRAAWPGFSPRPTFSSSVTARSFATRRLPRAGPDCGSCAKAAFTQHHTTMGSPRHRPRNCCVPERSSRSNVHCLEPPHCASIPPPRTVPCGRLTAKSCKHCFPNLPCCAGSCSGCRKRRPVSTKPSPNCGAAVRQAIRRWLSRRRRRAARKLSASRHRLSSVRSPL